MHAGAEKLTKIWNQRRIPVILRRTGKGQQLRVRLPYDKTNRQWLQNGRKISPVWVTEHKCWGLPKAWFNDFVERSLAKYGKVYIIQPTASIVPKNPLGVYVHALN